MNNRIVTNKFEENLSNYIKNHLTNRHLRSSLSLGEDKATIDELAPTAQYPEVAIHEKEETTPTALRMAIHEKEETTPTALRMAIHEKEETTPTALRMAIHEKEETTPTALRMAIHEKEETTPTALRMAIHEQVVSTSKQDQSQQQLSIHEQWRSMLGLSKVDLPFLNAQHILDNRDAVVDYYYPEQVGASPSHRKLYFFQALNHIQCTNIPCTHNEILIDFENAELAEALVTEGMMDAKDLDHHQHLFIQSEREIIERNIKNALGLIQVLSPELHNLIHQVIGSIVCFKKEGFGGGSVSSMIGLIWLNPQSKWTVINYAECIVHEFVHNSVFLSDMVHNIFPDTGVLEQALVTSTILKRKRALDKSYHSAAVAIGIMYFYYLLNDWAKVNSYVQDLRQTLEEANNTEAKYLSNHGHSILLEMNKFVANFNFEDVTTSLHSATN